MQYAFGQVIQTDDHYWDNKDIVPVPHFIVKNDMMYRVVITEGGDWLQQLLLPTKFKGVILQLAHSHVLGGHLAVKKRE